MNHVKERRMVLSPKVIAALSCMAVFLCVLFSNTIVAHAADSESGGIFNNTELPGQIQTVYFIIIGIGIAAAAVSLVVCGVYVLVGGEKAMEFCRKWGFKIALTIMALLIMPNLLVAGYNMFISVRWDPTDPRGRSPVAYTEEANVKISVGGESEDSNDDSTASFALGMTPLIVEIGGGID